MNKIVGLLLAAGSARRFGNDKLLQRLPNGKLIIAASARTLADTTDRCIALIRPDQPLLNQTLTDLGIECIEVMNANEGMGVTLASGVQATRDAAGWVVTLGDMPCIKPGTIRAVAKAIRLGADIAAPFHEGQRGHPVGFAARWGEALSALTGDTGARDILRKHANEIVRVLVDDPGSLLDIDTPADLQALSPPQGLA